MKRPTINAVIKLMVSIVDRGRGERVAEICEEQHVPFHLVCLGFGTASSEILDYLGLGGTDKDVVLTLIPQKMVEPLQQMITERLQLYMPGKGILFTIPLSGISGVLSQAVVQDRQEALEQEVTKMENSVKHDLIVVVINQGYTDAVMNAAKQAGATGGTVIYAHGISGKEIERFMGISIQAEREIIGILTKRETKQEIMKAINQAAGLQTEAKGFLFSLPVDSLMGMK